MDTATIDVASHTPATSLPAARRQLVGALGLALLSALLTYGVVRWGYPFFRVSSDFDIGMGASNEARLALLEQTQNAARSNATLTLAIANALLGLALAAWAGGCCNLLTRLMAGGCWGGVWGAVVGWIGGSLIVFISPANALPSLTNIALAHALPLSLAGAGLGAMVGGFHKSQRSILANALSGVIGGAAAGVLYAVLVGFVSPGESSSQLIANHWLAQLLWLTLPALAIAAMIYRDPPQPSAQCTPNL